MAITSILRRENAVTVGLLTAVAEYLIYQHELPSNADVRGAAPHNTDVEAARKQAAWESAALLGAVFLVTRDLNAFIIGGIALVGVDASYKHANAVNPSTGKADMGTSGQSISNVYPLPDYTDSSTG